LTIRETSRRSTRVFATTLVVAICAGSAGCSATDEDVFAIKVVDDTPRPVVIGLCTDQRCASGDRHFTDAIEPGASHGENVVSDRGLANAFLVTTRDGRRVGCLFLSFRGHKRPGYVARVSRARPCP
jgi:hypothetical protein